MNSNLFRFIGFRHLRDHPGRTVLTSLGVALGVALFVAIQMINRSTLESFRESVEATSGKAELIVSGSDVGFPESRLSLIQKTPGVKHAVPMVETRAFLAGKNSGDSLTILGVDLLQEQSVRTYKTSSQQVIDDPLIFLNQPDSIILTRAFAQAHGLGVDSPLVIATAHGKTTLTVRGLLTPEGPAQAYGGSLAIMDIDGARATFGKEGKIDRIDIVPQDSSQVQKLAETLRARLGPGYRVDRPEAKIQGMNQLIKSYQVMLSFFSTLALLVGVFLVTNSVNISVAERRKEIGILRALGATRSGILTLFMSEALAMGFLGSCLGIFLGRLLARHLLELVTQSLSIQYFTQIHVSHLVFGTPEIVKGILIGSLSALIAAFIPSFKATTVKPLEAMKNVENKAVNRAQRLSLSFLIGSGLLIYLYISSIFLWEKDSPLIGVINQVVGIVGPALVGPTLVTAIIFLFQKSTRKILGTVSLLAQSNLLQNPKRLASNVTTLLVGLVLVILVAAVNMSFKNSIVSWFDSVLKADLLVSSYGRIVSYQVQPLDESLAKKIDRIPGVLVGPQGGSYGLRFIHLEFSGKQIGLKAYDEPSAKTGYGLFAVQDRDPQVAGRELFSSSDLTVLVSDNFVLHFKKKTGDVIELNTPQGVVKARIIGVMTDFASAEGVIYMSRDRYKKLWNDRLVDAFGLFVKPGVDRNQVRSEIEKQLGKSDNLATISQSEMRDDIIKSIDESFSYTRAIETAALMVSMLSLLNTFLISVMERYRELGILRAVGMSRSQIISMILQEALTQGFFGALVAVALGAWIASLWIRGSLSFVLGWVIHFYFPWAAVGLVIFLGVVVSVIAGIYPAWRAAHLEIREALDYE